MATKTLIVFSLVVAFVLIASSEGRYTNGGYGNNNGGCGCIALWDPVCGANGQTYSNSGCLACAGVRQACTGPCPCWKPRY